MKSNLKKLYIAFLVGCTSMSALADIAVICGTSADPVSKDQLTNLYLGRSFERKLLDQPEGTPLRDQFYKKVVDREPSQVKAIWARVVFTGKGQAPLMLPDAEAIKKAVATDPKAIGYIDKSQVDASVKVLMTLN